MIVPGWYGMASVKWLNRIEALDKPYRRLPAGRDYIYRKETGGRLTPVTHMRVKSLLIAARLPDFYSRARIGDRGRHTIHGRAWSAPACRSRGSSSASTGMERRARSTTPKAGSPGAAGRSTGSATPASTILPAAPPDADRQRAAARGPVGRRRFRQQRRAACARQGEIARACGHGCTHIEVSLWRGGKDGRYQVFSVPLAREPDRARRGRPGCSATPTRLVVSLRLPRRHVRQSCAMTVNGRPRWTCRTHISQGVEDGSVEIGPLANLPSSRTWPATCASSSRSGSKAKGAFAPSKTRAERSRGSRRPPRRASPPTRPSSASTARVCYCGLRYGALERGVSGPAALNRAWTLVNDVRDAGTASGSAALAANGGCHACHSHQSCQEHCPNKLNPTASIAGLKRRTMQAYLQGEL
jgi:fumarate reductase iron-sulfur subunit